MYQFVNLEYILLIFELIIKYMKCSSLNFKVFTLMKKTLFLNLYAPESDNVENIDLKINFSY